jgi:hypothetical protein
MFIEAFNRLEEYSRMLQMNAEVIRSIVREELHRAVPPSAVPATKPLPRPGPGDEALTVKDDSDARAFFNSLGGFTCSTETIYANACVLNGIRDRIIAETGQVVRRKGSFGYFVQMTWLLDGVWAAGWRYNLPGNVRRLRRRFYAYIDGGYRSLVNGNTGNQHAKNGYAKAFAEKHDFSPGSTYWVDGLTGEVADIDETFVDIET